jgi:hypothetical protein
MVNTGRTYSSKEKANYFGKIGLSGKSGEKKLTDGQRAAALVTAARFQRMAERTAKNAEYFKDHKK